MKKIILSALVAASAIAANAQVYVGGSLGFNSFKANEDAKAATTFTIAPEIGYNFNENWAVGANISFQTKNTEPKSSSTFGVDVYARYTFAKTGIASFFVDGGVGMVTMNNERGAAFNVGVRPGIKVALSEKVDLVAKTGLLGYTWANKKAGKWSSLDLGIDNTALSFGAYYNF